MVKPKLVVVYLSTQGNTKKMADAIAHGAEDRGMEARSVSFYEADMNEIRDADAIALGSSTFWYKMHDAMERFIERMGKELGQTAIEGKVGAAFGSYGWSGEAPVDIARMMRSLGIKVIDPVLRVQYEPNERDLEECKRLGKDIASAVKKTVRPVA
ncbi:flavodoxin domain-containing protein [Methanocella conradii]|uniref:flavodoxin domain-containing protein n=1 Tax=Methanocella conradii TaxID=1175444 RepID=UPI0024B3B884|nr:flavodoxin domain-containing protein [Methanocella conradii]MDI6896226.1 flavodoxin domain-containing protein [Methanocella conradii]